VTVHQLQGVLAGDLDPLIEPAHNHFGAEKMQEALAASAGS
jgi:hypothetical protein